MRITYCPARTAKGALNATKWSATRLSLTAKASATRRSLKGTTRSPTSPRR